MKFEQPPMPSPEEMAKIEKERALSDAELLKGGAEYKFNEKGEKRLDATDEQLEEARKEMKKDSKESRGGLKSTKEMIAEQLSRETEELQKEKNAEQEKIIKEFEKSLNELQKDIRQGNVSYRIDTPIPPLGIKDEKADFLLGGEKVKNYPMYGGGIRNCSKEQLNRRDGGYISRIGLSEQFEQEIYSDENDKEKIEFLKNANAFISLTSVNKINEYYEKKKEKGLGKFFKESESVKIREERGEAKIKDLIEGSFIGDKNPNEKIFHLNIAYQNEIYPRDITGMSEEERNRRNLTRIAFYIGEKEANNILNGIRVKPEKFWEIINKIEPNILNVVPSRQESFYGVHALLVKVQGKEDEILQWPRETEKQAVEKSEAPPELPPDFPPSAKRVSSENWKQDFPEVSEYTKRLLRDRYGDFIEIGKSGLKTKYGEINGSLIWVDNEFMFGVFETPQGKIKIPLGEILDYSGIPYGERKTKKEQRKEPPATKSFSR
mgnify:CR=1 FL=1